MREKFEAVDLSEVLNDALLPFEPVFFEKGLELHSEIEPEIKCSGSESHLRQAAEILLDNAHCQKHRRRAPRQDLV